MLTLYHYDLDFFLVTGLFSLVFRNMYGGYYTES